MMTNQETLRSLCKTVISRLENDKVIAFPARLRQVLAEELQTLIRPLVLTEEDLRTKALDRIGARSESLSETGIAETDQFRAARAVIKSQVGDNEVNGFYFQRPIIEVAQSICGFLMRSSLVDDVFETDEDIERKLVDLFKKFNPRDMH